MGFLDRAKAAANDLVATVDQQLGAIETRDVEKYYRDLGMLTYLSETERSVDEADRQRLMDGLRSLEERGGMPSFRLITAEAPTQAPPPPGAAGAATPPPAPPQAPQAPQAPQPPPPPPPPPTQPPPD